MSRWKDKRYREWRKEVLGRDKHKCTKCGSKEDLHAHHIKPWAEYPSLRYDCENGSTLCRRCHYKEHEWMARSDAAQRVYKENQSMGLFYDNLHEVSVEQAILQDERWAKWVDRMVHREIGGRPSDYQWCGNKVHALASFRMYCAEHLFSPPPKTVDKPFRAKHLHKHFWGLQSAWDEAVDHKEWQEQKWSVLGMTHEQAHGIREMAVDNGDASRSCYNMKMQDLKR